MNWLAHLFLSESDSAFRVGNLLPDFLGVAELADLDPIFRPGINRHRQIDRFTDQHPAVRHSVRRLAANYRRLAPVLVDVFYDHFLSLDWKCYSRMNLSDFIRDCYDSMMAHRGQLPPKVGEAFERMRTENWLASYADAAGLCQTLERMERRFRRPIDLRSGLQELERNYLGLREDFRGFFPELQAAVAQAGSAR